MDFFSEQDQARRSTKILVLLFSLSVFILIVLTNILAAFVFWLIDEQSAGNHQAYQQALETLSHTPTEGLAAYLSWQRFGSISLGVTGIIACAIIFKWVQLSGGGKRVAEQLGGQRIHPNTDNKQEKRLLNVVEEMAIASGMPVPAVYLLADEVGINAFAAGSSPADAVIGVTRGSIEQFNRKQLQGVIAHEFSHILNGDMRLNIRLIALLHGILFVGLIGEMLLHGSSHRRYGGSRSHRRSGDSRVAILGLALLVIGWLGRFFGNWIKSAVSRQREFLADASAVQFTRDPQGIADALKIIGGYQAHTQVQASRASEMSHLFFGQAISSLGKMFATHPPLDDRISRIEPSWNGQFIFRDAVTVKQTETEAAGKQPSSEDKLDLANAAAASAVMADAAFSTTPSATSPNSSSLTGVSSALHSIPKQLRSQAHDPFGANAILFALLLDTDKTVQEKQLAYIKQGGIAGLSLQTLQLQPAIATLDPSLRLVLIELALPALKCMSAEQYKVFCKTLLLLIRADNKFELFEWCLYQLVRHYLDPEFGKVKFSRPKHKKITAVAHEFQCVLSLLCHFGDNSEEDMEKAFNRGANTAGLYNLSILPLQQCKLNDFVSAVNTLANCYPLLKPRLLKGLAECAKQDGKISTVEQEMITAIAAVMDSPMPLLV